MRYDRTRDWDTWIPHVFGPSEYAEPSVCRISDYHRQLQGPWSSIGRRQEISRIGELQQCLITKLELLKYNNDHEHELVLAHIEHCDGTKPQRQYFRLERDSDPASLPRRIRSLLGMDDDDDTPITGDTRSNEARNDWIIRHADVRVTKKSVPDLKLKGQTHLCYTVSFSGPDYPTILDLSSAARMLSDVAPHYKAFDHMCYWFSHNLCRVLSLGRQYSIQVVAQDAGHWQGVPVINGFGQLMLAAFMPAATDAPDVADAQQNTIVVDDGSSLESIPPMFSEGHFTHSEQVIQMWRRYRGVFEQTVDVVQVWEDRQHDRANFPLQIEMMVMEGTKTGLLNFYESLLKQEKELYRQGESLLAKEDSESSETYMDLTVWLAEIKVMKEWKVENRHQVAMAQRALETLLRRREVAWVVTEL
ncbi:hypothetical protein QCA50_012366 [Cerrena zonata]|uniref:Uncharacterized protein n=1 Tax=Cerrena zonata TaxID=2478898 RepID=A0AAW0FYB9_9APHY